MSATRIAAYALVASALLGLGLELTDDEIPRQLLAVGIIAFVALDVVALASLATLRHDLSGWAELGLLCWGVGIAAGAYSAIWIVWWLTGGHPSFEVGIGTYFVEQIGRTAGQALLIVALATAARRSAVTFAAILWGVMALAALVLDFHLYWDETGEVKESVRHGREVAHAGSLVVLGWIANAAGDALRAREPTPARVVS